MRRGKEIYDQIEEWIDSFNFNVKLTLTFNPNTLLKNKRKSKDLVRELTNQTVRNKNRSKKRVIEVNKNPYRHNRSKSVSFMRRDGVSDGLCLLGKFLALQDGDCFGNKYNKQEPGVGRSFSLAFPEYGVNNNNLHFHLFVKVPKGRADQFIQAANENWAKLVPNGDCEDIDNYDENGGWKKYAIKDYWKNQTIIPSTIFSRQ